MKLRPPRVVRRLLALFNWGSRDIEMDQEMAFHLESITADYVRSGMSQAEAARAAGAIRQSSFDSRKQVTTCAAAISTSSCKTSNQVFGS